MIRVTEKAARKIQDIIAAEGKQGRGIRLGVVGGGCSGFQYSLAFEEGEGDGQDEVVRFDGFDVLIDKASAQVLQGAEIDYLVTDRGEGFKVTNPNSRGGCGCDESFRV